MLLIAASGVSAVWWFACGQPPGKGRRANAGYRAAEPVIVALNSYYRDRKAYPGALADLTPQYLDSIPSIFTDSPQNPTYEATDSTYTLTFRYTGPGMNECSYSPSGKDWICHGYY